MAQKKNVKNMMNERLKSEAVDNTGRKIILDMDGMDPQTVYSELKHNYTNMYYNVFKNGFEWEGDINYKEIEFIMKK